MRRIAFIVVAFLAFATVSMADKPLKIDKLPVLAQEYIKSTVPEMEVTLITRDGSDYDVLFSNGTKISFDRKGEWHKIKNNKFALPEKFVPALIREKVLEIYPGSHFESIEKDGRNYEIELMNGIELTFNNVFKLVHIDE